MRRVARTHGTRHNQEFDHDAQDSECLGRAGLGRWDLHARTAGRFWRGRQKIQPQAHVAQHGSLAGIQIQHGDILSHRIKRNLPGTKKKASDFNRLRIGPDRRRCFFSLDDFFSHYKPLEILVFLVSNQK